MHNVELKVLGAFVGGEIVCVAEKNKEPGFGPYPSQNRCAAPSNRGPASHFVAPLNFKPWS
jgi:hypothetical protein